HHRLEALAVPGKRAALRQIAFEEAAERLTDAPAQGLFQKQGLLLARALRSQAAAVEELADGLVAPGLVGLSKILEPGDGRIDAQHRQLDGDAAHRSVTYAVQRFRVPAMVALLEVEEEAGELPHLGPRAAGDHQPRR